MRHPHPRWSLLPCLLLVQSCFSAEETCRTYMNKPFIAPEKAVKACTELCERDQKWACDGLKDFQRRANKKAFSDHLYAWTIGVKCDGESRPACEARCDGGEATYCVRRAFDLVYGARADAEGRDLGFQWLEKACALYDPGYACGGDLSLGYPRPDDDSSADERSPLDYFNCRRSSTSFEADGARTAVQAYAEACAHDCFAQHACDLALRRRCEQDLKRCEAACVAGEAAYCRQSFIAHREGRGTPKDGEIADQWRQRACEAGDRWSCDATGKDRLYGVYGVKSKPTPWGELKVPPTGAP